MRAVQDQRAERSGVGGPAGSETSVRVPGDRLFGLRRDDLADEIAAMANTSATVLVFGLDADAEDIVGLPEDMPDVIEARLLDVCECGIEPAVAFHTYRVERADRTGRLKVVFMVDIPRSPFVHKSPGGYLRRQASGRGKMPPEALARLFQQRAQARSIRFEVQTVPDTGFGELEPGRCARFAGGQQPDHRLRLRKLGLLQDDQSGVERATVAGVLACAPQPEKWLPGALILAARYRGTRRDVRDHAASVEITGPVDEQIRRTLDFVRTNMAFVARKDPARLEVPQFSMRAVFEAIVNAVAHRDYSIYGSKIRVFMFDDRIEIYSPGPLPDTVTVESLELRQSTRNELLTSLLAKCPVDDPDAGRRFLMEKRGDGVPIILAESEALSGRRPEYRVIDDAEVLLTIWGTSLKEPAAGL